MAKRTKSDKRQEDDRLDDVRFALEQFDERAPLGTYKMDSVIDRLVRKHGEFCASPNEAFRRHIRRAGLAGVNSRSAETAFRLAKQSGANLLQKLQQIRNMVYEMSVVEPEILCGALAMNNEYSHSWDPETEALHIEQNTEDLFAQIINQIDPYLAEIYLPRYLNRTSNRTIKFTHRFIAELAGSWKQFFYEQPKPADLADLTELVSTCLEDFRYPLTQTQRESNVWISDRIRKQLFRNSPFSDLG
jgi:hypothetical protein